MSLVFSQLLDGALHEQAPSTRSGLPRIRGAARFQLSGQLSPPRAGVQRRVSQPDLGQGAGLPGDLHRPGQALYIPNGWNKPLWTTDCSVLSLLFGKRQLGFSLVSKRREDPDFFDVQSTASWPGPAM